MKRFTSFFTMLMCMLFSFSATAQEGGAGTTNLEIGFMNGSFDECANQVEIMIGGTVSSAEKVSVPVGTEILVRAAEGYSINAVYYCNEDVVANAAGVYSITADREGDAMIVIDMKEAVAKGTASVKITGRFFNVAAQNADIADNKEAELFQFNAPDGIDKTEQIDIVGEMNVRLVAQAEDNAVYVAVNGQPVASENPSMFEKVLTLKPGDEVVVLNEAPSTGVATVNINGNFYTFSAQNVNATDPRAAELFSVNGEVDETKTINVDGEMTVRLVGQAENNAIYVTLDGQQVASEQADMFQATVTLKAGSVLNITNEAPSTGVATVNINGNFYTFSAQNVNATDPRAAELFSVNGEVDETKTINVDGEMTVRLVGQAENNAIYVTLNGQPVASTQETMFEATVTIKAGDVINITNEAPSTGVATVNIKGNFYNVTAQDVNVDDPRAAEIFSYVASEKIETSVEITVNGERTIRLIAQSPEDVISVTLNGETVASKQETMFEAEITIKAGDVINVTNDGRNSINTINETIANGKIYNMQGMEVKAVTRGMYIVNGKKIVVK